MKCGNEGSVGHGRLDSLTGGRRHLNSYTNHKKVKRMYRHNRYYIHTIGVNSVEVTSRGAWFAVLIRAPG